MSKKHDAPEPDLIACDNCVFQSVADSDTFFCLGAKPLAQRADGLAQWPKIHRSGLPAFKGCGEGRRKKDAA
jgi:hypothetical protein